jgi:uncharacterized RDD family membrane protein YckC
MNQQTDMNILQDIEQDIYLERVGPGLRFANFLIDTLVYYGVLIVGLGFLIFGTGQDVDNSFLVREDGGSVALQYLVSITSYLLFFTLLEGATKGKTLGKFITGTRALKNDGNKITWKDALLRSLSRMVPFEVFSAFGGNPWHDKWTDTIVIKDRK